MSIKRKKQTLTGIDDGLAEIDEAIGFDSSIIVLEISMLSLHTCISKAIMKKLRLFDIFKFKTYRRS